MRKARAGDFAVPSFILPFSAGNSYSPLIVLLSVKSLKKKAVFIKKKFQTPQIWWEGRRAGAISFCFRASLMHPVPVVYLPCQCT
jgi:hypothetical protein